MSDLSVETAEDEDDPPVEPASSVAARVESELAPDPTVAAAPPRAQSGRLSPGSVAAITILVTVSALVVWVVAYAVVLGSLREHGSQRQLYAAFREQQAAQTGPIGGAIDPGAPIATISAPSIGLDNLVIVEGTNAGQLQTGPGHLRNTVLPGQPGASVVMGRSQLFGAPFAHVVDLRHGDTFTVSTGQGDFTYVVDGTRQAGDPLPAPPADGASRLTLVTSQIGAEQYSREVVYIDSTLQGAAQPVPPDRTLVVTAAEAAMTGDQGALIELVLWLEGLVAVVVVLAWAGSRWGRKQTLIVGVPIVLAVLWGVTETATLLLPNLV